MMRSGALAVMALVVLSPTASACREAAFKDEPDEITRFLQQAIEERRSPGLVALVVGCQGTLYHEAFGVQDAGRNIPMRKDSIFRIASMTKPLTSLALMILAEQGKVSLDDKARNWVPRLGESHVLHDVDLANETFSTRPARTDITIRHLLSHTSGIGYGWSDPGLALAEERDPQQFYLVAEPGTRWVYGSGTQALGEIVSAVSGEPFDRALKRMVLDPIGTKDTGYFVPLSQQNRVATVYHRKGRRLIEEPNPVPIEGSVNADGGLYSTAEDYGRFVRLILNEGELDGVRVASAETIRAMTSPQIGDLPVATQPGADRSTTRPYPLGAGADTWGFGFQISREGGTGAVGVDRRSVGSLSWAGLYNTHFWIDPARGIGAVLLMQKLPFYDEEAMALLRGFEEQVYKNLK